MTIKKLSIIAIILSISNLTLGFICSATIYVSGSVTIEDCLVSCLTLHVTPELNDHKIHWANNLESNFKIIQNPSLNEQIMVDDIRSVGSSWQVDVVASDLTNVSRPTEKIHHTNIGILTFNNSTSSSVDSTIGEPNGVIGPVDKNYSYQQLIDTASSSEFVYFPSSNNPDKSSPIIIMVGDSTPKNESLYTSIGFNIIIPPDSNPVLEDGAYQAEMTFTLSVL